MGSCPVVSSRWIRPNKENRYQPVEEVCGTDLASQPAGPVCQAARTGTKRPTRKSVPQVVRVLQQAAMARRYRKSRKESRDRGAQIVKRDGVLAERVVVELPVSLAEVINGVSDDIERLAGAAGLLIMRVVWIRNSGC